MTIIHLKSKFNIYIMVNINIFYYCTFYFSALSEKCIVIYCPPVVNIKNCSVSQQPTVNEF